MSYTINSQLNGPAHQRERDLLGLGLSYAEVAKMTGCSHKALASRNQIVYHIDLQSAFAERIKMGGTPSRLSVSDEFGYWFSGFFDGEGCLTVLSRPRGRYVERRVGIQISLRNDDSDVIHRIKDNLQIGVIWTNNGHARTNPNISIRIEKVQDLAEIIVPLFEKYPLFSKKSREFIIWKDLVAMQYISTLGGYSQRTARTEEYNAIFDKGLQAIRQIRAFSR